MHRAGRTPRRRTAVAVGAGLTTLLVVPAHAQPEPACNLVRDSRGDDAVHRGPAVVHLSDSLDILSGDVATTPKVLIAVIRVARLGLDDETSPAGQLYSFELTTGTRRFRLTAKRTPTGDRFSGSVYDDFTGVGGNGSASMTSIGTVGGFFDDARSEIHIRAPIARLRMFAPFATGDHVSRLRVDSYRNVGDADAGTASWADEAVERSARHTVGEPTCVRGG